MIDQTGLTVIVGLGATGLSCARFLAKQNIPIAITDDRKEPPQLKIFQTEFPHIELALGAFSESLLNKATEIIISPGVSLKEPAIVKQAASGKSVIGDIELLARHIKKPVLGITGSNGKTTVTTLLGLMVHEAGMSASVCGNIGEPVLEQLTASQADYYVVELSSFQLETTYSLHPMTATILNVTPDHMDRYAAYEDYLRAKQRIYKNCIQPVVNADEPQIWKKLILKTQIMFSLHDKKADFSITKKNSVYYLSHNNKPLIATPELKLNAPHHWQNALAALAMGEAIGLPLESGLTVLRQFTGLPHRCQWIRRYNGADWYNDSKGTNVGATQAAILSLGAHLKGKLILIAGGQGKGADFSSLQKPVGKYVKHTILIGEDAPILETALQSVTKISHANSMDEAVKLAASLVQPDDVVLLSPACASFDMFNNFEHRGEVFVGAVKALF